VKRFSPAAALAVGVLAVLVASTAGAGDPAQGARVYSTYCVLCHGRAGAGDGPAAQHLQGPPPANLQQSTLGIDQIRQIVSGGGRAVGRSPSMPVWSEELSGTEIADVVAYVATLRRVPALGDAQ